MARGGFPMGGGNMSSMVKQAQKMQKEMERIQKEISETVFTANSGGNAVSLSMFGNRTVKSLEIKPEVVDPEDIEMLQDLIIVAIGDCLSQIDSASEKQMGKITGGLPIF